MTVEEKELFSIGCGVGVLVMMMIWLFVDLIF